MGQVFKMGRDPFVGKKVFVLKEKYKAVVLLSGGIDSTTCLALAVSKYGPERVLAITTMYGQKHAREIDSADKVCAFYEVDQIYANLAGAFKLSDCPLLLRSSQHIKHQSYADQLQAMGGEGTVDTYVPFRNGLFLSYAAAVAVSKGAEVIYYGAHADDAAGRAYPDCTPEFADYLGKAIYEGSGRTCKLEAPLINLNKAGVVKLGLELGAPYEYTWSCYEGGDKPCGTCGTCVDRRAAFEANGVSDPAMEV